MKPVRTGLESIFASPLKRLRGHRLGILCNPASVDTCFQHARKLIHAVFPGQIKALFSPQHGFFSEKQDNMVESADMMDAALQIPVYSLYGVSRVPTRQMFDTIDTLIIDLQDVGARVYTYASTISFCLETAKKLDKQVVLLDRPNPLGGMAVEGNCLESDVSSFVGRYPIPMRHGMTIGELSMMMNQHFGIGCRLHVVPMEGWHRRMYFPETGLPWIAPSPNLPTFHSAMVYPGQVIWEGTNVSEGRGTTQPFEYFGTPYLNPDKLKSVLKGKSLPGITLREIAFEPTSNKWAGSLCKGFQIHVVTLDSYKPYEISLLILQAVLSCHKEDFKWKQPPYEYEYEKMPIDLIIGSSDIRERIERQEDLGHIVKSWEADLERFKTLSKKFYLYT
jgi:uncharacterized protein YbbC (DUF1343 family)